MISRISKKIKKWYKILKGENLHQTVISFLLTFFLITIGGLWFNYHFQNKQDQRQREYEFYRFQLEKKDDTMTLVSENINLRYLNSVRVLYSPNSEEVWKKYNDSVTQWNVELEQMRQNIITYYGWEVASQLIDKDNDSSSDMPKTIHYKFIKLHNYFIDIRNGDSSKIKKAQQLEDAIVVQKNQILTEMIEELKVNNESLK